MFKIPEKMALSGAGKGETQGDRKGEWSIYLGRTGYRITLVPSDDKGQEIWGGDIIAHCKIIKIVVITEVSNHYE